MIGCVVARKTVSARKMTYKKSVKCNDITLYRFLSHSLKTVGDDSQGDTWSDVALRLIFVANEKSGSKKHGIEPSAPKQDFLSNFFGEGTTPCFCFCLIVVMKLFSGFFDLPFDLFKTCTAQGLTSGNSCFRGQSSVDVVLDQIGDFLIAFQRDVL